MPGGRIPGAVHPEAVLLAGADAREVAMPAEFRPLRQIDVPDRLPVEQTDFDAGGDF
jgi:hypothetical protein